MDDDVHTRAAREALRRIRRGSQQAANDNSGLRITIEGPSARAGANAGAALGSEDDEEDDEQ